MNSRGSEAGMMQTTSSRTTATNREQAIPMLALAQSLAANLHNPVLDKTGLTGECDFTCGLRRRISNSGRTPSLT